MEPFVLESERLNLTPEYSSLSESDRFRIIEACNDSTLQYFLVKMPSPYQESDLEEFLSLKMSGWNDGSQLHWFIRSQDGTLLGSIEIRKDQKFDSVGIWMHQDARGNGYAVEAIKLVSAWSKQNHFTVDGDVWYAAIKGNVASATAAKKAGFVFENYKFTADEARTRSYHSRFGEDYPYMVARYCPESAPGAQFEAQFGDLRIGHGFDVHPFGPTSDLGLCLGCISFPGTPQLKGHSDGDVVAHALADAILSGIGAGDIGQMFGVNDPKNQGISGFEILRDVRNLALRNGFEVHNASVNIICESPKIAPRRSEMQAALSTILFAPIAITASTGNECLQFAKPCISATAQVLLKGVS
jgi:2-C-methyl-D-erythritol 2,4-cyclodiphosphate synthase